MKKIAIFAILLGINLVHANDVCNEYIKQSRLYLDELYAKESKRLANDEKALRLFELKFDQIRHFNLAPNSDGFLAKYRARRYEI